MSESVGVLCYVLSALFCFSFECFHYCTTVPAINSTIVALEYAPPARLRKI